MIKSLFLIIGLVSILFGDKLLDISDVENKKTKTSMQKWLDEDFGLKPYRANYILPFGYADTPYVSNIPTIEYRNIEAELQVSLKVQVAKNLFGLDEKYYVSYTHQAFWQIYINSAPFRENLYNPEAFVIFPIQAESSSFSMRSLKVALAHRSNGQPNTSDVVFDNNQSLGNLSRSVNYVYSTLRLQDDSIVLDLTAWLPFPEDKEKSDNPDLMDYTGYSSAQIIYFVNENMFSLKTNVNFGTTKGALEATYSHPLGRDYLYVKFFSGYGESLIDYNRKITKLSVGFSFSR